MSDLSSSFERGIALDGILDGSLQDMGVCQQAGTAPLGKPEPATPSRPSGRVSTDAGHTPGPWRWEVNLASKRVELCGGPPKRGFGRYDLTVMGFKRYGIQGAAPVFWDWDFDRLVGDPHRADELAVPVEGREHHARWFADINHPDARLIAASPELLSSLVEVEQWLTACLECKEWWWDGDQREAAVQSRDAARAAIAKAEGR